MKITKYVPDNNEFSNPWIKGCMRCSVPFKRGDKIIKPFGKDGFTFHPQCCIEFAEAEIKRNEQLIKEIKKALK